MILLARVFPLSERSAVNVLGGFNVGNETRVEGREEFERGGLLRAGDAGNDGEGSGLGYEFYAKFWGVQKVFTDPTGTILTSSARGGGGVAGGANNRAQAYESFVKDITDILEALESTPIVHVAASSSSSLDEQDKNQQQQEHVRHHKYLTSSQLLHLQLKDPTLRIHFLTQLLIILAYLGSLPPTVLPTGVQSTAGADTSKLTAQIRQTQMKQLALIEKRVQKLLLRACGGDSNNSMWKSLQWILRDRESMWKNWKKAKCLPAMDRVTATGGGGSGNTFTASGSEVQKLLLAGKKRKLEHQSTNSNGDSLNIETLAQVTTEIKTSSQPTLTTFLDPYVEALDPENGIEGEYHPRNDKVYTWRALRLMARDQSDGEGQLKRFGKLRRKDGDFEGIVRDIWKERGEEIPGEMGEDYYQEEVEEEEVGAAAAVGGKNDAEMDDVSVGSTQEEAEAKKEEEEAKKKRMAEFEKAAMEVEEDILDETDVTAGGSGDTEKAAAIDEGQKSNRSSYASLADIVAPAEEPAKEEQKKDAKPVEVKEDKKAESKKEEKTTESKKENGKDVKKEENGNKKGSPNKSNSAKKEDDKGKNGGGKGKKDGDNGKKDGNKGSTKSASNNNKGSDNNKNDSKQHSRSRAKFTPPQKVQQHQNKSEPQRDNRGGGGGGHGGGHGGGGGGGGGNRRGGNDRRGNNMPPPPQSRGGNRDGHGRAHTPPNPGGPGPRGGDQRGNNGPPRGGGGPGRGWEPPPGKGNFHPGQGGGGGRGGGGGGGRGGSDRRRQGRR